MAQGKDPETRDGLGGVHKVTTARQRVVSVARDDEPVVVAEGQRAGFSRLVDDPDQLTKAVHTQDASIAAPDHEATPESTLRPMRTPEAPFQDAQTSPDAASVWTAAKTPSGD